MAALHERLRFDTANGQVLDDQRRYLLLRTDVLMGLFDGLSETMRAEALRAFGRSVAEHGADSVRAYAASAGTAALPAMMEDAAASLGWGRWRIETTATAGRRAVDPAAAEPTADDPADARLHLQVDNSPFAAGATAGTGPACHAIAGMLEALATALWNAPAHARETHCAAAHGGLTCRFVATPVRADDEGSDRAGIASSPP